VVSELLLAREWSDDADDARPFVTSVAVAGCGPGGWEGRALDPGAWDDAVALVGAGGAVVTFQPWVGDDRAAEPADVGRAAASFHRADRLLAWPTRPRWVALAARVAADPVRLARLNPVVRRLGRVEADLAAAPVTPVHGDLRPDNVVIGPAGPVLVDLEFHRRDARVIDIGALALPGRTASSGFLVADARSLAEALVAYDAHAEMALTGAEHDLLATASLAHAATIAADLAATDHGPAALDLVDELLATGDALWAAALSPPTRTRLEAATT